MYPRLTIIAAFAFCASGCTVISVVDTAASVAIGAVKVTAKVAETAVDVTAAGVRAATKSDVDKKPEETAAEGKAPNEKPPEAENK